MSYDLLVFDSAAASGPAARVYAAVCEGHPKAVGCSALLRRFVERLEVDMPEMFTECEVEDASLDPDGTYVLLSLPLGCDQEFVDRLMVIVSDSGLTAFDPQREPTEPGQDPDIEYQLLPASESAGNAHPVRTVLFFDGDAALVDAHTLFATPLPRRIDLAGKSRAVARFVQRMRQKYPELAEAGCENWSRPVYSGNYFMLHLDPTVRDEVLISLAELARRCGLTTYDSASDSLL